jgi:putative tryptophan/tyrosine transport system substrate-binding protein
MFDMRRRDVIVLLSGGAAVWPLAAHAQQPDRVWRIGYLSATETPGEPQAQSRRRIMEQALARLGYVEGRNLVIERRLLSDQVERLNAAAAELAALQPDAIVAVNTPDVEAALSVTRTIPIVFVNPANPIGSGFAASLARPGGNATGITGFSIDLVGKRLGILQEIAPGRTRIGFISMRKGLLPALDRVNQAKFDAAAAAAKAFGLTVTWHHLPDSRDPGTIAAIMAEGDQALYVAFDPLTIQAQKDIVDLAIKHKIPTVYEIRDYVISGGLMSYTFLRAHSFERAATFLDRIFKGANPAELPVEQPTRFELVINLKSAKAIDLAVPDKLIALADEVIE